MNWPDKATQPLSSEVTRSQMANHIYKTPSRHTLTAVCLESRQLHAALVDSKPCHPKFLLLIEVCDFPGFGTDWQQEDSVSSNCVNG